MRGFEQLLVRIPVTNCRRAGQSTMNPVRPPDERPVVVEEGVALSTPGGRVARAQARRGARRSCPIIVSSHWPNIRCPTLEGRRRNLRSRDACLLDVRWRFHDATGKGSPGSP